MLWKINAIDASWFDLKTWHMVLNKYNKSDLERKTNESDEKISRTNGSDDENRLKCKNKQHRRQNMTYYWFTCYCCNDCSWKWNTQPVKNSNYEAKISNIDNTYINTADYNRFTK